MLSVHGRLRKSKLILSRHMVSGKKLTYDGTGPALRRQIPRSARSFTCGLRNQKKQQRQTSQWSMRLAEAATANIATIQKKAGFRPKVSGLRWPGHTSVGL